MSEQPSMLDAALAYAERGWPVFPVSPRTKAPMIPKEDGGSGHLDATTDPEVIKGWWTKYPDAAIGNRPGEAEAVIDTDPRAGGNENFDALTKQLGPLPPTVTTATGGDGQHLRLRGIPAGFDLPKRLAPGVELKGHGGYVILPPSLHPSGKPYRWAPYCDPEEQTVAELPAAWLEAIKNAASRNGGQDRGPGVDPAKVLAGVPAGERDEKIFGFACYLRGEWIPWLLAEPLVLFAARAARPPFPDADALKKLEQAWKYPAGHEKARQDAPQSPKAEPGIAGDGGKAPGADGEAEGAAESGEEPKSVSLAYCLAHPAPPLEWRTAGLLPERGIAAMIGKPKIGKTVLAFQWGLCVAAGAPWLPFEGRDGSEAFDCRSGRVLYVDEETGREVLESRLRRQMEAHEKFKDPETLERFRLICFARFSLQEPKELRREIELVRPDFIIWDSFRRIFRGEENSSAEVSQAVSVFASIRDEIGCSQLILHHTRKDPDGDNWADAARGSGDFFAAVDSMIAVSRVGKGLVSIRAVSRAAREVEPFTAALEEETLTFCRTSAEASAGFDNEEAMAEILADSPGQVMTIKVMTAAMYRRGRTESQIRKAIAAVPLIDPQAPPAGCRIGKVPIPGTKNERKLVLVG